MWKGPSQVIATNGKKLFVDQGARLGTTNRDNAVRVGEEFWRIDDVEEEQKDSVSHEQDQKNDEDQVESVDGESRTEVVIDNDMLNRKEEEQQDVGENNRPNENEAGYTHIDIKKNDIIRYKLPDSEWETVKILSRAGKATGKNKYWWNVEVLETGNSKSVNTENLEVLERVVNHVEIEEEIEEVLVVLIPRHLHNQPECIEAKEKELENWDNFGTYEEVEDVGQKTLNTNWVLVKKADGVKARLCVRGDQERDKEHIRTDSLTVHKTNVKLFYLIATINKWKIKTADVKAAFLQGADLDRDVYVRPPKERRVPGVVWKMVKRAYGFVDASQGFYLELEKLLLELGCVVSIHDPAMYMFYGKDGKLNGMVLTHVDDMLHGSGGTEFENKVMKPLKERFTFGKEKESNFKYVGLQVFTRGDAIVVNQDNYVDSLQTPDVADLYDNLRGADVLTEEYQGYFRELVGKIGWMTNTSHPDLCYDKVVLNTKVGKATVNDMKLVTKLIRKLKTGSTEMKFPNLGSLTDWTLQGYGDAGYKSLPDQISSCGGQVVMITNKKKGLKCIVSWRCRKLRRVVSSSTAAEALSVNDTLDELVYVKEVLKELLGESAANIPIELFTDSRNLYRSVMSTSLVDNPRLRTEVAKLQESLKAGEISKFWQIPGHDVIADCLTKKGASAEKLLNILRSSKS